MCWLPNFALFKAIAEKPDVVHIFFPMLVPWPVILWAWLCGVRIYCSHHVDMEFYMGKYMGGVLGPKFASLATLLSKYILVVRKETEWPRG